MEGHLVICHWAPRGLHLIREVHSKLTTIRRPVVIVAEDAGAIDLPDAKGDGAFESVYIVRGDPSTKSSSAGPGWPTPIRS